MGRQRGGNQGAGSSKWPSVWEAGMWRVKPGGWILGRGGGALGRQEPEDWWWLEATGTY